MAVIRTARYFPLSNATALYVLPVAPVINVQFAGFCALELYGPAAINELVHRYHWKLKVTVGEPAQLPRAAVKTMPTFAVPEMLGATRDVGTRSI